MYIGGIARLNLIQQQSANASEIFSTASSTVEVNVSGLYVDFGTIPNPCQGSARSACHAYPHD